MGGGNSSAKQKHQNTKTGRSAQPEMSQRSSEWERGPEDVLTDRRKEPQDEGSMTSRVLSRITALSSISFREKKKRPTNRDLTASGGKFD